MNTTQELKKRVTNLFDEAIYNTAIKNTDPVRTAITKKTWQ